MSKLKSINPSNYSVLGEVEVSTEIEIKEKVKLARKAQNEWGNLAVVNRVEMLGKAVQEFATRKSELTLLESREMGMPISDAYADFDMTLDIANWYLKNTAKYLSPERTFESDKEMHQIFYEPVGLAAVIIPWNFPFANVVWGAFQSTLAGNTVVLKHSEEVPLSGKIIEDILTRHLPKGVFNEVYGGGEVGKHLVQQNINMIAFTGSTKTGKYLYETAGKKFIKAVMELGGSAPGVIFNDADIDLAVGSVCGLRLFNTGQCCDGLKRLIVQADIFDKVVEKIAANFSAKKIGSAEKKGIEIGPLVAKRQLDLIVSQVKEAIVKGAKAVTGGNSLEIKFGGAFIEPTVLTGVTDDMRVWTEEVFGPVLPIVKFVTEQEAIELANQTMYGLGAYVFTQDLDKADRVAKALKTGMVSINGTNYIMPFNPYGGYKNSGFGREHGRFGFHEASQIKVVARNK